LNELIEKCLPKNAKEEKPRRCLELFARNLMKGWHSVGNEVIQFQQIHFFEQNQK